MRTQLYAHNKTAYQKVVKAFEQSDRTCVVHPTGTGKSYLIAAVSESYQKVLILGPNIFVLDQVHDVLKWRKDGIEYMTYSSLMFLDDAPTGYDLIVLDEFHRAGAQEWGAAVLRLLDANGQSKIFGTSATPIRFLDNERDMAVELFHGNIASHITIGEAWNRSILPQPTYVTGLFDFMHTLADAEERVRKSDRITDEEKRQRLYRLSNQRLEWEQSMGMPTILQRHLDTDIRRVLIFCANINRLESMRQTVVGWFRVAGFKVAGTYTMHKRMSNKTLREAMNGFESDDGDGVRLMFSVNMLNEGIHIPRVGAVLMLRTTSSRIIYLQQMGRCLTAANTEKPVVLDMVDNITTTTAVHGLVDMEHWIDVIKEGIGDDLPARFEVVDYKQTIREVLEKLSPQELVGTPFENSLAEMLRFCAEHDRPPHCNEVVMYRHWIRINLPTHREHPDVKMLREKYVHSVLVTDFDARVEKLIVFCEKHKRFPMKGKDGWDYANLVNIMAYMRRNGEDERVTALLYKYSVRMTDEMVVWRILEFYKEYDRLPRGANDAPKEERNLRAQLTHRKHLHSHPDIAPLLERFAPKHTTKEQRIKMAVDFCHEKGRRPKSSDGSIMEIWTRVVRESGDDPRVKELLEKYPLRKWRMFDDELREYVKPLVDFVDQYQCQPPSGRQTITGENGTKRMTKNGDLKKRLMSLKASYADHPMIAPLLERIANLPTYTEHCVAERQKEVKQQLIAFVNEHHRWPTKNNSDEERALLNLWSSRRKQLLEDPEIRALHDQYVEKDFRFDDIYPPVLEFWNREGRTPNRKTDGELGNFWDCLKNTFRDRPEVQELIRLSNDKRYNRNKKV